MQIGGRKENANPDDFGMAFTVTTRSSSNVFTEGLRITGDAKVGIGTTNPQDKLHVAGNVRAQDFVTGDLTFKKDGKPLWRMYEEQDGLYLENIVTSKRYRLSMQEVAVK